MAGKKKTYAVNSRGGLNVRELPSKDALVLRVLAYGDKVSIDNSTEAPSGWKAIAGGGFVMEEYIK